MKCFGLRVAGGHRATVRLREGRAVAALVAARTVRADGEPGPLSPTVAWDLQIRKS